MGAISSLKAVAQVQTTPQDTLVHVRVPELVIIGDLEAQVDGLGKPDIEAQLRPSDQAVLEAAGRRRHRNWR